MKKIEVLILTLSIIGTIALVALALLFYVHSIKIGPIGPIDLVVYAISVFLLPYGIYFYYAQRRIKKIEDRLPDFLRDVAEAGRFGMTLSDAIMVASTGRYGLLTEEIKKMAGQIQVGVPVNQALEYFRARVDTPLVNRMVSIIIKANEAGGNVADVLTMVAHAAKEAQLVEKERVIDMQTYTFVMIIAFGVFIVTIVILATSFLPEMLKAGTSLTAGLKGVQVSGSFQGIAYTYIPVIEFLLVISALISAIGDGILAGVLKDGKYGSGLITAFALFFGGYVFFKVLGLI
jgi:flagellar protein FlaJ